MAQVERLTNNTGIPLSIAVWLATDEYDHIADPFYISATTLIKSPRQIILGMRSVDMQKATQDIAGSMPRAIGNAVHSGIENSWSKHYKTTLAMLGYKQAIIDRIRINPEPSELTSDVIPIYMEQRAFCKVGKFTIGGKFDFVGDGILDDFKTTGVFSYTSGSNEWKYKLQGSLYRWLNPELITGAHMNIQFIFTDWSKKDSIIQKAKGYPATKIFQHKILLMSVAETDVWVNQKIALLESLEYTPEAELPLCGPDDLWQDEPIYKYYKNPLKKSRSTANFATSAEAQIRWIEDGRVGVIDEVAGTTKGCLYCEAFNQCSQKDALIANGSLRV